MASFGAAPPKAVQPQGRGWGKLGGAAVVAAAALGGSLAYTAWNQNTAPADEKQDHRPFNVYQTPDLPRSNNTVAGYARQPVVQQPVQQLTVPVQAQQLIAPVQQTTPAAQIVYASPPPAPRPLVSGFVGQMSPQVEGTPAPAHDGRGAMAQAGEYRPGMQDNKNEAWLATAGTGGMDFVTQPFMPPISRYMIQRGITIKARLLGAMDSDLPGDVVAMIPIRVCDTPSGRVELIPAGSKLYGRYNSTLGYGQTRGQIAWNSILFADGSSQSLGAMNGVDDIGRAGVTGNVNHHPWGLAGAVALSTFSTLIGQAGTLLQGGGDTTIGVVGADAASRPTADIGNQLAQKEISRQNTLEVCMTPDDPTCNVAVLVSKDLALPPRGSCM